MLSQLKSREPTVPRDGDNAAVLVTAGLNPKTSRTEIPTVLPSDVERTPGA